MTSAIGGAPPEDVRRRQRWTSLPVTTSDGIYKTFSRIDGKNESHLSDDLFCDETEPTPIDEAYRPKLIKCETQTGKVRPVPVELLREASVSTITGNAKIPPGITREPESRVLVLYTGGTIGMKIKDGAYAPEPNYLPTALRQLPHLNDQQYVDAFFSGSPVQPCVLPPVKGEDRRVVYWVFEYEPLLDSCDATFDDWIKLAEDIYNSYEKYDGFVVLHGTDTLCYTASALSFMFENLGKSIVLTGAQIPVAECRSDGRENFIGALIIAANYDIPEVTIYFNNKLFRGNRTSKIDNSGLDAFNSPNIPPLATTEINIKVDYDAIFRSAELKKVFLHKHLNRNVGLLRIFPSVTVECIRAFVQPPMEAVVLQTFGSGNIPTHRKDIVDELKRAVDEGMIIVNCSQCARGQVDSNYQAGKLLQDIGVVAGSDMTPEAALTKLAYVLGKETLSLAEKKRWVGKNLRGELTVVRSRQMNFRDDDVLHRLAKYLHISSSEEMSMLRDALFPAMICTAAGKNDIAMLQHLKECGAVLTAWDYDRRTALHVAASNGHLEAVAYLLAEGVSLHMRDCNDETPLMAAVRKAHIEVVEVMVKAGAHLTLIHEVLAVELCILVCNGDIKTLQAWIAAGADINVADYDRRTPLHISASRGLEDVTRFLLNNGAKTAVVDNFNNMPIDDAIRNGHKVIVQLLRQTVE